MWGLWLQVGLIGLTAAEKKALRAVGADSVRRDSLLRSWGYWGATGLRFRLEGLTWEGDSAAQAGLRRYRWRRWRKAPLTPALFQAILLDMQSQLAAQGYLYARVAWERFTCNEKGACFGQLRVRAGEQVRLDTVILRGRWPAPKSAFYQITGLVPGRPLSAARWEALPRRLRNNPYAILVDTPKLWLFPGLAWIELTLRPKNNNRIDGALSLLPSGSGPNPKPQVIGNLEVSLISPLRLGEKVEARFAQLPGGSQRLNLTLALPYLLRGLIELRGSFLLWRQDTSFLTREGEAEVRYRLAANLLLKGGFFSTTSRLLNTRPYEQRTWPPPPVLDFRRRGLRLGWEFDNTDLRTAPTMGWRVALVGTQGQRGYLRNPALQKLEYQRLPAVGTFQEAFAHIEKYFALGRLLVLRSGVRGYHYWAKGFFENELARLGGENSLRGFAENTLPAAAYLQGIAEVRLRLEEEGYLGAFAETSYLSLYPHNLTQALAAGISLQTRLAAGLFRITFANGRLLPNPWDLRRTLVTLLWVSEF